MTDKHSPPEWKALEVQGGGYHIMDSDGRPIASTNIGRGEPEREAADVRLITASPELLAKVREQRDLLSRVSYALITGQFSKAAQIMEKDYGALAPATAQLVGKVEGWYV